MKYAWIIIVLAVGVVIYVAAAALYSASQMM
jgi:hypothetical protein